MGRKKHLLYIDDEVLMQRAFERSVRRSAYDLQFASSGAEGIELAAGLRFDLIVCDYLLWDLNGVETLRRIRELQPAAILVLTSGSFDPEDNRELLERAGVQLFVAKPWSPDDLCTAIENLLNPVES